MCGGRTRRGACGCGRTHASRDGREQAVCVGAGDGASRDQLESAGEEWSAEDELTFKAPIREQYERQGNAYYSTARLWDDGIVDPVDTRMVLGLALGVAGQAPLEQVRYGVFRM
jgi:3-methylcrotonyl-CoA carboxylase beta subunit